MPSSVSITTTKTVRVNKFIVTIIITTTTIVNMFVVIIVIYSEKRSKPISPGGVHIN